MNDQADESIDDHPQTSDHLLATGGGNSPASGVTFQGSLGASLAIAAVLDRPVDSRLGLGSVRVRSLRFETEAPVDDILVPTSADGHIFAQAKASLEFASKLDSEMGKTALEIVRNWRICSSGDGGGGWDRPLSLERDRFLIAVGPKSSGTVVHYLGSALDLRRNGGTKDTLNGDQKAALTKFRSLLSLAWSEVIGTAVVDEDIDVLLDLTTVLRFDFDGADRDLPIERLRDLLVDPEVAPAAFEVLARECERHMKNRTGLLNIGEIRRTLETGGLKLVAPKNYQADIEAFQVFSERIRKRLAPSEAIALDGKEYPVHRQLTDAAVAAVTQASLLLVGEPGAGKSGVLNQMGSILESTGAVVLRLSVETLPMQGLNGLREGIGLAHPIRDVLANWPGVEPAFLLVDGLDASRDNDSEPAFRTMIEETLALPGSRWKVLASIRSFDLRHGEKFRSLFSGSPPSPEFAAREFSKVRHVEVTPWTKSELDNLLERTPRLASALTSGGQRLQDLALVPFNTQLLAELISDGVEPGALQTLSSQADLLELYWRKRVQDHGPAADSCLRRLLREMIEKRSLQVSSTAADLCDQTAFTRLLKTGVLVQPGGNRYVAFRHNILFDYAASHLYLDPAKGEDLKKTFERGQGLGLLLSPALGYALQELWSDDSDRSAYWETAFELIGDKSVDPIARSVGARSCCELPRTEEDVTGLIEVVLVKPQAAVALHHIVGSLSIRLEDNPGAVPLAPWARLAAEASTKAELAGVLSFLVNIVIARGADVVAP
jgi:energy-coupling factor transporter ATP-binding protein EcfA2